MFHRTILEFHEQEEFHSMDTSGRHGLQCLTMFLAIVLTWF